MVIYAILFSFIPGLWVRFDYEVSNNKVTSILKWITGPRRVVTAVLIADCGSDLSVGGRKNRRGIKKTELVVYDELIHEVRDVARCL